jgi:hypothetical protein
VGRAHDGLDAVPQLETLHEGLSILQQLHHPFPNLQALFQCLTVRQKFLLDLLAHVAHQVKLLSQLGDFLAKTGFMANFG